MLAANAAATIAARKSFFMGFPCSDGPPGLGSQAPLRNRFLAAKAPRVLEA
jgi:hypothetical protein